jgi:hypothetical protein
MKLNKIVVLFVAILLMAGLAIAATPGRDVSPGKGDIAGNVGRYDQDPHKTFRLVRYVPVGGSANSATLAAESIVVWDLTSKDGVTVTTTTTSYDSAVAGIIVNAALTPQTLGQTAAYDAGKRNWTWLQTYGLAEVRVQADSSTVTAGDALAAGSTAGEACDFLASASASNANGNAGVFLETGAAAADDVLVFLKCE